MNILLRRVWFPVLALAGAILSLTAGAAEPTSASTKPQSVIPDRAFREILKESNAFIQQPFQQARSVRCPLSTSSAVIRANALLIALAAQNRLATRGPDAARLAALRDTAVKLAVAIEQSPCDEAKVQKLADAISRYPDIPVERGTSLDPIRLKSTFNHDDVASILGGCGGNKTQRLEFHLFKLKGQKTAYTQEQTEKVELLAYKIALVAELLREMDGFIAVVRPKAVEERAEWVRFATDVQERAWTLAATAGKGNSDATRQGMRKIADSCCDCHAKFRD